MERRLLAALALLLAASVAGAALYLSTLPGAPSGQAHVAGNASQPAAPQSGNTTQLAGQGEAANTSQGAPPSGQQAGETTPGSHNASAAAPGVEEGAGGSGAGNATPGGPLNGTPVNKTPGLRERVRSWAIQLQDADPGAVASSGFDLVVMDYSRDGSDEGAYTRAQIEAIKEAGVIPVAYLSIGEAEDYRFYWREEWSSSPPPWLGPENPEWRGNYAVRYWNRRWKAIVFKYLDKIIAQGFAGVYLDKVDEYEYWAEHGVSEEWAAREMIKFILEIARYAREKAGPGFIVIPQNGETLLDYDNGSLLAAVSGWASEDVFYDGLEPSPWTKEKVPRLDRVVKAGKPVLVVDYVDDGSRSRADMARILDFREKALAHGYVPYAALVDRELDELNIIPGVQPPRG